MTSVEDRYQSIRGPILSAWQRSGTGLTLSVTVPPGSSATVYVPTSNPAAVTEGGSPAGTAPGVTSRSEQPGALVLGIGSGQYVFVAP